MVGSLLIGRIRSNMVTNYFMKTFFTIPVIAAMLISNEPAFCGMPSDSAEPVAYNQVSDSAVKEAGDAIRKQRLTYRFQNAETYYSLGFWMTAGGLAAMVVPAFFKVSDASALVITSGFLSYQVGIPLLAFNTSRMKGIARQCDTAYKAPMGGWPFYLTGKGLQVFGIGVITVSGVYLAGRLFLAVGSEEPGLSDSELKTFNRFTTLGGTAIGIGVGIELFSWYRFTRVHRSAKSSFTNCSLSMGFLKSSPHRFAPGLIITGDF
jgi:hypothetical protein